MRYLDAKKVKVGKSSRRKRQWVVRYIV